MNSAVEIIIINSIYEEDNNTITIWQKYDSKHHGVSKPEHQPTPITTGTTGDYTIDIAQTMTTVWTHRQLQQ